jgi:hypothetical protein
MLGRQAVSWLTCPSEPAQGTLLGPGRISASLDRRKHGADPEQDRPEEDPYTEEPHRGLE